MFENVAMESVVLNIYYYIAISMQYYDMDYYVVSSYTHKKNLIFNSVCLLHTIMLL